jgi:hypothetical protein
MNELSPRARALVDAARDGDQPTPADRDRVGRALAGTIAGGAVMLAAGSASTAAGALSAKAVAGLVVASVMVGGTATVGVVALQHPARTRPAVVQTVRRAAEPLPPMAARAPLAEPAPAPAEAPPGVAPAPAAEEPRKAPVVRRETVEAPTPTPMPTPSPMPSPSPSPTPTLAPTPTPTARADTLAAEARDLRQVQRALQDGDAVRALGLLDAQAGRYPGGVLAEERAAARVVALCQAGRQAEAAPAISAFLRTYPRSPLVGRVRSACRGPLP